MADLRDLYTSLGFEGARTWLQSGNVVFRTRQRSLAKVVQEIESGIEKRFGFHSTVMTRTAAEMREIVARNPFSGREDVHPSRFVVFFLASDPGKETREKILAMPLGPQELRFHATEMYVHFQEGFSQAGRPWLAVEKALNVAATGRNWNTVRRLLAMAEEMEES